MVAAQRRFAQHAGFVQLAQGVDGAVGNFARRGDFRRFDFFPRQGVVFGLFADFFRREDARQADVRGNAAELGAAAVDAVEHRHGEFHRTKAGGVAGDEFIEVDHGLHGAFAEAVAADDEAATVVLDGGGEDFGGRGRVAVDEDGKRAVVGGACVVIGFVAHAALGVGDEDDRAFVDKESDGFHGFVE